VSVLPLHREQPGDGNHKCKLKVSLFILRDDEMNDVERLPLSTSLTVCQQLGHYQKAVSSIFLGVLVVS